MDLAPAPSLAAAACLVALAVALLQLPLLRMWPAGLATARVRCSRWHLLRPVPRAPIHSSRSVAPSRATPPAVPASSTSSGPGFGSMMMQGMALGAGSSIAHHAIGGAVNAMSGGGSGSAPVAEGAAGSYAAPPAAQQQQYQAQANMCAPIQQDLARCLETNTSDISMCQPYFDQFKSCQQQMAGGQSFM